MKKIIILTLLVLTFTEVVAQETTKQNHFDFSLAYKLGISKMNTLELKNFNGNVQSKELLFGYFLGDHMKISSGIGLIDFDANMFTNGELSILNSQFIQIPLKLSTDYHMNQSENIKLILGVGVLGNYHLRTKIEDYINTIRTKNNRWHFGVLVEIGVDFKIVENLNVGLLIESNFSPGFMKDDKLNLRNNMLKLSFAYKI